MICYIVNVCDSSGSKKCVAGKKAKYFHPPRGSAVRCFNLLSVELRNVRANFVAFLGNRRIHAEISPMYNFVLCTYLKYITSLTLYSVLKFNLNGMIVNLKLKNLFVSLMGLDVKVMSW